MTTTFDQQENVILLHGILQGLRNTLEIPSTPWHETDSADKVRTWDMVTALAMHGYDFQNVYDRWWQAFPFGVAEYVNLNMLQKDIVNLTFNVIRELMCGYGEILREDFPDRVTLARASLRD